MANRIDVSLPLVPFNDSRSLASLDGTAEMPQLIMQYGQDRALFMQVLETLGTQTLELKAQLQEEKAARMRAEDEQSKLLLAERQERERGVYDLGAQVSQDSVKVETLSSQLHIERQQRQSLEERVQLVSQQRDLFATQIQTQEKQTRDLAQQFEMQKQQSAVLGDQLSLFNEREQQLSILLIELEQQKNTLKVERLQEYLDFAQEELQATYARRMHKEAEINGDVLGGAVGGFVWGGARGIKAGFWGMLVGALGGVLFGHTNYCPEVARLKKQEQQIQVIIDKLKLQLLQEQPKFPPNT